MIYASESANVVYAEMPKAACSSIKAALLGSDGINVDGSSMHDLGHWRDRFDTSHGKFAFTFVRHPFTRLESSYHDKLKSGRAAKLYGNCPLAPDASFEQWVAWVTSQQVEKADHHWAPQFEVLRRWQESHRRSIDFIGKMELLHTQWEDLRGDHPTLPRLAKLNVTDDRQCEWTCRAYRLACEYFQDDLLYFDYDPEAYRPHAAVDAWKKIQGWCSEAEASELQRQAAGKTVLEVGTWQGRSAIAMAASANHVVACDHFYGDQWAGHGNPGARTWERFVASEARERVTMMTGSWRDVLPLLDLSQFEFIYYDADHTYRATKDFLNYVTWRSNAVIGVHDYEDSARYAGAKQAVDETGLSIRVVDRLAILGEP